MPAPDASGAGVLIERVITETKREQRRLSLYFHQFRPPSFHRHVYFRLDQHLLSTPPTFQYFIRRAAEFFTPILSRRTRRVLLSINLSRRSPMTNYRIIGIEEFLRLIRMFVEVVICGIFFILRHP